MTICYKFQVPDVSLHQIIEEYKEEMFGCGQSGVGASPLVSCGAIPLTEIELRYSFGKKCSVIVSKLSLNSNNTSRGSNLFRWRGTRLLTFTFSAI
jgi:hypothetical protein